MSRNFFNYIGCFLNDSFKERKVNSIKRKFYSWVKGATLNGQIPGRGGGRWRRVALREGEMFKSRSSKN